MAYIAVCAFCAFFFGQFMADVLPTSSYAAGEGEEIVETLTEGETLLSLNDMILGGTLKRLAGSYSGIIGISAEPFTGLLFLGIMQNLDKLTGNPLNMPDIPVGHPAVLAVVAVCFIASKFMKANESTKVFGICTLGYLEKFLGTFCVLAIGILTVIGVAGTSGAAVVNAATAGEVATQAGHYAAGVVSTIFAVFMAVMSLIVNYIVKTVMLGLDVLQNILSFIPFSSVVCEVIKTALVVAIFAINVIYPPAGYVINIIVFIICCLLFKACYNAVEYLKKIYIYPFFVGIFGYKEDYPLKKKHLPFRVKKAFKERLSDVKAVIPLYTIKKPRKYDLKLKLYERVWLVVVGEETGILFRKYNGQRNYFFKINTEEMPDTYLRKGFRFFELYNFRQYPDKPEKKHPKKNMDFVFSREYRYRFDEIIALTGCVNVNQEKMTRRQERKAERKAWIESTKETVSDWWSDKFKKAKNAITGNEEEPVPVPIQATESVESIPDAIMER